MAKLTQRARKDLEALPGAMQENALHLITRLDAEPAFWKKLLGKLARLRSAQLGRSQRIMHRLDDDGPLILTICKRKDAYK